MARGELVSDRVTILLGALALDVVFGEPPAWLHPVVWMGRMQQALRRLAPKRPLLAFFWGAFMAAAGPCVFGGLAWLLLAHTHDVVRWILAVFLLKSAFAVRALAMAGWNVSRPLAAGNLDAARAALGGLVSRDTKVLAAPLVAAAAVESVAENTSDSIVAPFLFYALGGVPGALAYRAINTLDAMIGYRGELEWLGKAAARLDDLVNLVPARVTALLLALAAPLARGSVARAAAIWARDRRLTESPNAGHPMAAMAGVLGVELEKIGHYRLGGGLRAPEAADVDRAVRVVLGAAALAAAIALAGVHRAS
jgi:adenosylcobinamide-phosphate synthase